MTVFAVLLILALVCFIVSAAGFNAPVNTTALGLAFLTLGILLSKGIA